MTPGQVNAGQPYAAGADLNSQLSTGPVDNEIVRCGRHAVRLCRPWVSPLGTSADLRLSNLSSDKREMLVQSGWMKVPLGQSHDSDGVWRTEP